MKSIKEVSEELENDLQQYIESRYHLHHPRLLKETSCPDGRGRDGHRTMGRGHTDLCFGRPLRELGLPNEVVDLLKISKTTISTSSIRRTNTRPTLSIVLQ